MLMSFISAIKQNDMKINIISWNEVDVLGRTCVNLDGIISEMIYKMFHFSSNFVFWNYLWYQLHILRFTTLFSIGIHFFKNNFVAIWKWKPLYKICPNGSKNSTKNSVIFLINCKKWMWFMIDYSNENENC